MEIGDNVVITTTKRAINAIGLFGDDFMVWCQKENIPFSIVNIKENKMVGITAWLKGKMGNGSQYIHQDFLIRNEIRAQEFTSGKIKIDMDHAFNDDGEFISKEMMTAYGINPRQE